MSIIDYLRQTFLSKSKVILEGAEDGYKDNFYVDIGNFVVPKNVSSLKVNGNILKYVGQLDRSGELSKCCINGNKCIELNYNASNGLSGVHALLVEDARVFYKVRKGVVLSKDDIFWGFVNRLLNECNGKYSFRELYLAFSGN